MDSIGKRIVGMREKCGITQVRLSQIVGVTKATMSKYENNISVPNAEMIGMIADALDTTTDYLIGRSTDYSPLEKDIKWVKLDLDEKKCLAQFQTLTATNKIRVLERMEVLIEEQQKKSSSSGTGNEDTLILEHNLRLKQKKAIATDFPVMQ